MGAILQDQEQKLGEAKSLHKQMQMAKEHASINWHQTAEQADEAKMALDAARRHAKDASAAAISTRKEVNIAALGEAQATQALQRGKSELRSAEAKRDQIVATIANSDESVLLDNLKNEQSTLQDTMARETIVVNKAREASRSAALKVQDLRTVRDRVNSVMQSATNEEANVKKNKLALDALDESTLVHKQDADIANAKSGGALSAVQETVAAVGRALGTASQLHDTASKNAQDSDALVASSQAASNAANAALQQATAALTQKTSDRATAQDSKVAAQQVQSDAVSEVGDSTTEQKSSEKDLSDAEDVIAMKNGRVTELENAIALTRADLALAASNIADKSKLVEEAHATEELLNN